MNATTAGVGDGDRSAKLISHYSGTPADADSILAEAVDEFMDAQRRGEACEVDEFARRYPPVADMLRQVLLALMLMEGRTLESDLALDSRLSTLDVPNDESRIALGDYRILREVGRGGMGVVYEAEQVSLGRRVALKVLPFAAALDARHLQRFKTEAQAAAQLQHQNIVPVYAVGCERGVHYYAMQFIDGHPLSAVIADLRKLLVSPDSSVESPEQERGSATAAQLSTLDSGLSTLSGDASIRSREYFRTAAALGIQAAEGLEHAHQLGIVHRDIKPANLLLDARMNLWIADFGLAQVQSDSRLTMTGDILGTLRYMSPEQALGNSGQVDHRSDIYSLGATLYELLTLEPAFDGDDRRQLLRQIAFEEPKRPGRLNRAIPADLQTIVLKAIAKLPDERYATAAELADDLRRFLDDRPIRARRPTLLQRGRKLARRHRGVTATAVAATFLSLLAVVGVLAVKNREVRSQIEQTENEWARAEREKRNVQSALNDMRIAREALQHRLYLHNIALAHHELLANDVVRARRHLDDCPVAMRNWEWHYLDRACRAGTIVLRHSGRVFQAAFSPDGKRVVVAGAGPPFGAGKLTLFDSGTGRVLRELKRPASERNTTGLAFHADGRTVIYSTQDRRLKFWNTETGATETVLRDFKSDVAALACSPDGERLALVTYLGRLQMLDLKTRTRRFDSPLLNGKYATCIAFSRDGGRIAVGCMFGTLLFESATGRGLRALPSGTNPRIRRYVRVRDVAFHPDGRTLAAANSNGTVVLWDVKTGRPRSVLSGHVGEAWGVSFRPDGRQLASCGTDRSARIWDVATGRELAVLRSHTDGVRCVTFDSSGTRLLTGSFDWTARVWDVEAQSGNTIQLLQAAAYTAFDKSGWRIALFNLNSEGRTDVLRLKSPHDPPNSFSVPADANLASVFRPETGELALARRPGEVQLLHPETFAVVRTLPSPATAILQLAFRPDGSQLAGAGAGGNVYLWDPAATAPPRALRGHRGRVRLVTYSADGTRIASASTFRTSRRAEPTVQIIVWNVASQKILMKFDASKGPLIGLTFIPRRPWLAAAEGRDVVVWDVHTGRRVRVLTGHGRKVVDVDVTPDGSRLVTCAFDGTIKLWETDSGNEVLTLRGHTEPNVRSAKFTADGARIVSYGMDMTIRIWDGRPLAPGNRR